MAQTQLLEASDSETEISLPEFTRLLLIKKTDLLSRAEAARRNLDEQVVDCPGDEADLSSVDSSADYFLRISNALQDELREINAAFDRISRRVYGQCQACEEPIGVARLRHLPVARLCIDCQSMNERQNPLLRARSK